MAAFSWFFDRPSSSSGHDPSYWKPKDFLQNTFYFPSFQDLPHENDIPEGYWKCGRDGAYVPACTWFFMAEITNADYSQQPFLRNRVLVKDRASRDVPIYFYPECGFFDFKLLKKGHTVLVMRAQRHDFLDLSTGLRIEDLSTVQVAKCSMEDLLTLSKAYHDNKDNKCWSCGKEGEGEEAASDGATAGSCGGELKKCAACKTARYCSKECQTTHWMETHKRTCKAMPLFMKLAAIDLSKFNPTSCM